VKRIPDYALALLVLACGQSGGGKTLVADEVGGGGHSASDPAVFDPTTDPSDSPILTDDFPPYTEPTDPCQSADAGCDPLPTGDAGPACGDGILDASEACDDGNGAPGDGCSGSCQVELNFECPQPGAACVSTIRCGDAIRVGAELCDDGNTVSGDGCNATCDQVEGVFSCPPNGGPCATNVVCGDGRVTGAEVCDDGNAADGDGCSATCLSVTAGYSCFRPGQLCVQPVVCGDGHVSAGEQCDEGLSADGQGCTAGCFREADFACDDPGQPCVSLVVCGDGILLGDEECDDGNLTAGDGCSATCVPEPGWACPVVDSSCEAAACGDGVIAGDEECEDGDVVPAAGDGCDANCRRETGFQCDDTATSPPSTCHATVCNDGTPEGDEPCDDGDNEVGDGCNPFCQVEPTCDAQGCQSACGDGIRLPGDDEQCDDGNTTPGDGCSATCQIEHGFACTVVQGTLPDVLELPVTFRDFIAFPLASATRHPDFEFFNGAGTAGLVASTLGIDKKPVYTGICDTGDPTSTTCPNGPQMTTQANFDQWYRNVPTVNRTFVTTLSMGKTTPTSDVYQFPAVFGTQLFPLDNVSDTQASWVSQGSERLNPVTTGHNFAFTSEIRHWFEFKGGESLTFSGDDDVWVFINGTLALDLGGLHSRQQRNIVLDAVTGEAHCTIINVTTGVVTQCTPATRALGLVVGSVYEVSLFHAERHTGQSNFDLTLGGFVSKKDECASVCGDAIRTPDEACDDGVNDGSYGSCTPSCERGPHCGDGIQQAGNGEDCDNGINRSGYGESGCARGCKLPSRCGDGQVDGASGETCDDGVNDGSYGSCTNTCQLGPRCGDGIPQSNEQCDDGLNDGAYGTCAPGCLLGPRCGDGQTQAQASEQCDDGQNTGGYGQCQSTCQLGPRCGDGVVQSSNGEQCDSVANDGGYGECQSGCVLGPRCGDGIVQSAQGEQCDDSVNNGGYGECYAGCRVGARCGDGIVQTSAGEQCDDSNRTSNDGCSSTCRLESGSIH
jgi:fibro-slime domain-containing protein